MTEYTASNGYTILARENATVDWWSSDRRHTGIIQVFTHSQVWQALREFFQHERDEELGRWRWPENPQYVVYPRGDSGVHVLDEGSGIGSARFIHLNGDPDNPTAEYQAAYAYFEAHPERKPWEDAKPGEAWEITYTTLVGPDVTKVAIRTDRNMWATDVLEMELNHAITSARRIWPEDAS